MACGCDFVIGAHQRAQYAVSSRIQKEASGEACAQSAVCVLCCDGCDGLVFGLRSVYALIQEQSQVGLRAGQCELALIIKYVSVPCVGVSRTGLAD